MLTRRTVLGAGAALTLGGPAHADVDYVHRLSQAWGGPIDPHLAHRKARAEIARIHRRADRLLRGAGLKRGAIAWRLATLFADDRFLYPDDDSGRNRAVADMNAALARLRPRLVGAFSWPAPPAEVRRMPAPDEERGRGGFRERGAYYVDLRAIRERPAWTLGSVAFHETVPGHALQADRQAADGGAPYAGIFGEAWATYAEQLAVDLDAFAGDPRAELGYLHWRLFRMARVVGDTGQGALGWSLNRAVTEMRSIQGRSIAFVTIEADAARMRREPAVFAAQGLGALEIARLRPRSRAAWPAFHAAILADGPCPCAMLAERVTEGLRRWT